MKHVGSLMKNTSISKSLSLNDFEVITAAIDADALRQLALERVQLRQKRLQRLTCQAALPARFAGAMLDPCCPAQQSAFDEAADYLVGFKADKGQDLLLYGDIGVGKTHALCALANGLLQAGCPVMYCTAMELFALVRSTWRRDAVDSEFSVYNTFAEPDLLIIDEVGVQSGTAFEQNVLASVVDRRSRNMQAVALASNLDLPELRGLLGERTFDRLARNGSCVIEMRGPSLRGGADV